MRMFHVLVFDATIDGTTSVYIDSSVHDLLGMADRLRLAAVVDTVSGTSPTLTVQIEHSGDNQHWVNKFVAEINAGTLSTSGTTVLLGDVDHPNLPAAFVRARLQLGGTSPQAHVKLWITGRGEEVLSASDPMSA